MTTASKIVARYPDASSITAATAAELLSAYNILSEKKVARFSDRKTAERRLVEAIAAQNEIQARTAIKDVQKATTAISAARGEMGAAAQKKELAKTHSGETKPGDRRAVVWMRGACPTCGTTSDQTPAGLEGTAAEQRNFCHHCSTEYDPATGAIYKAPADSATRSAAIAASWLDPEVAARRAERTAVVCEGVIYASVAKAFRVLGLPPTRIIPFRGEIKAAGKAVIGKYSFKVAEVAK